jgi:uncharacterized tellurite resistance protein B-like protein
MEGRSAVSPSIEERLTAVEARVDEEATLRARMDADQTGHGLELRAVKRLVQDLGTTQNEQLRMLQEHRKALEEHGKTLEEHGKKLDEHSREFVLVNAKLDLLIDLVRGKPRRLSWRR